MADNVNHPSHYCRGKIECIDVMTETQGKQATADFCVCNALKYIFRHRNKNGIEDIKKAIWYLNKYMRCTVTHEEVESRKNPDKFLKFARLSDNEPADGFDEEEVVKVTKPAPTAKKAASGKFDLDSLLG